MADAEFTRRVEMIEAGLADDFQTVNKLLADDKYLWAFGRYLAVMSRQNPSAVEKSLVLPNIDRRSGFFDQMMLGAIQNAAYNNEKEFLEVLLKHAPAPAAAAQEGLTHMFNTMSGTERNEDPSPDVAAVLVRHGADIAKASQAAEMLLVSQQRAAAASLAKLSGFKKSLGA